MSPRSWPRKVTQRKGPAAIPLPALAPLRCDRPCVVGWAARLAAIKVPIPPRAGRRAAAARARLAGRPITGGATTRVATTPRVRVLTAPPPEAVAGLARRVITRRRARTLVGRPAVMAPRLAAPLRAGTSSATVIVVWRPPKLTTPPAPSPRPMRPASKAPAFACRASRARCVGLIGVDASGGVPLEASLGAGRVGARRPPFITVVALLVRRKAGLHLSGPPGYSL